MGTGGEQPLVVGQPVGAARVTGVEGVDRGQPRLVGDEGIEERAGGRSL
jgi:hypothetical protein